jgi:hypothetical protein
MRISILQSLHPRFDIRVVDNSSFIYILKALKHHLVMLFFPIQSIF